MKNIPLIVSLFMFTHILANELTWVDEQIQAIKPPRDGISKSKIDMVKDPFIFLNKELKEKTSKKTLTANKSIISKKSFSESKTNQISKQSTSFSLDAIINKSALINGNWYKLHSKVGKYTLSAVNGTSIILSYKNKDLLLTTRSKTKKLKFKNN
ncbi:MAG: hypothetical protein H8E76_01900 [Helicobacteraceae bacterium]|nr:hypothetical protein [Candidatus Sulfurimonas ponti]MBL6973109.1 hypothetical protein [Sulfurimonas sp.]